MGRCRKYGLCIAILKIQTYSQALVKLFSSPFFLAQMFGVASLCLVSKASSEEVLLAGWHDFSAGYQLYRYSGTPKDHDDGLSGVVGNLWGGNGARQEWGSNDGTYGVEAAVGTNAPDGAMSLRTDRDFIDFTITNNTGGSLELGRVLFDFASVNGNSPRNLKVLYLNGGLNVPDNTVIQSWAEIHNGLGIISNYEDVEVSLAGLADQVLAGGQVAKFRFQVDTASNQFQAMMLDNIAVMGTSHEFRVLTYNIHGGVGPNGEGNLAANLATFRDTMMNGEDVLCLQEVGAGNSDNVTADWATVKAAFPDYPYTFQTKNTTTDFIWPWERAKQTSIAILSKHPFESTHSELIQTDPQGDEWERHAQHVQIKVGEKAVDLVHFHNTYNFFDNEYASEKEGLTKLRDYALERVGADTIAEAERLIMLGDFNVLQANVNTIIGAASRRSNGLDHITSMAGFSGAGAYAAVAADLSDHNAVWVSLDLRAPELEPMTWVDFPTAVNETSITMTAVEGGDPNGLEYYFSNTSIPDGSHDSGWQNSPTFVDTGLIPATSYSYTVIARDKSANTNETNVLASALGYTDDGDDLPNDWELLYFPNLNESTGAPAEDWDNDGANDFEEWTAGTDPSDATSRFHAWMEHDDAEGEFMLKWSVVPDRSYRVFSSQTLADIWIPETGVFSPTGTEGFFGVDSSARNQRFFRIEVSR